MKTESVLGELRDKLIESLVNLNWTRQRESRSKDNADDICQLLQYGFTGFENMKDSVLVQYFYEDHCWCFEDEPDLTDEDVIYVRELYVKAEAQLAVHNILLGGEDEQASSG